MFEYFRPLLKYYLEVFDLYSINLSSSTELENVHQAKEGIQRILSIPKKAENDDTIYREKPHHVYDQLVQLQNDMKLKNSSEINKFLQAAVMNLDQCMQIHQQKVNFGLSRMIAYAIDTSTHSEEIAKFEAIREYLEDYCQQHLRGNWCLTFCMRARGKEEFAVPTVLIIYDELKETWSWPNVGEDLYLELHKDKVERFSHPAGAFPLQPHSSACIGVGDRIGTFGGYLKDAKSGKCYGLMSGHVAFNENGDYTNVSIPVEQPSKTCVDEQLAYYTRRLEADLRENYPVGAKCWQELIEIYNNAREFPVFGTVKCGQVTVKNKEKGILDWALIELNASRCKNYSDEVYEGKNIIPKTYNYLMDYNMFIYKMIVGKKVSNNGHTGGSREGIVSGVKSTIMLEGLMSHEITVMRYNFANKTDSGEWIANSLGYCGMIHSGCFESGLTFVTDLQYLLSEINAFCDMELMDTFPEMKNADFR